MASAEEIIIRITAQDQTSEALNRVRGNLDKLKATARQAKVVLAAATAGVSAFAVSAVKTAAEVQALRVRLKFMTGSASSANKAFQTMSKYASQVPFALEEIQAGAASLLTVADNVDDLNQLLEITGDIAAVSGLSFAETSMQLQRAFSAGINSAELFKERGVAAMLGFQNGVAYTANETRDKISSAWSEGTTDMAGATGELAKTFNGQLSMMQDAWFQLKLEFAQSGLFDTVTQQIQNITEMLKDPEFVTGVKTFASAINESFGFIAANWRQLVVVAAAYKSLMVGSAIGGMVGKGKAGKAFGGVLGLLGGGAAMAELLGLSPEDLESTLKDLAGGGTSSRSSGSPLTITIDEYGGYGAGYFYDIQDQAAKIRTEFENLSDNVVGKKLSDAIVNVRGKIVKLQDQLGKVDITGMGEEIEMAFSGAAGMVGQLAYDMDNLNEVQIAYNSTIKQMSDKVIPASQQLGKTLGEIFGEGGTLEVGLTNAIMGGEKLSATFKDVARQIAAAVIQQSLVKPLVGMASSGVNSMLGNIAGSIFGGFFADGGRPPSDRVSVVGERGAELFVPDGVKGTIIPNDQMRAMTSSPRSSGNNVVVNVIENPERAGQTEQRQDGDKTIIDVMVQQVKRAMISDVGRGGEFSRAMSSQYGLSRARGI